MARLEDMATIDLALAGDLTQAPKPAPAVDTDLDVVPGVAAPAPLSEGDEKPKLSADEKRAVDAQRVAELDRKKLLDEAMAAEKEKEDAFKQSANATINAVKRIGKDADIRLGSIPTPGGLTLPILVLLFFFFLLLPVNGHTRLTWLWLVLSGNAGVTPSSGGTPGNTPTEGSSSDTPVVQTTLSFQPLELPVGLPGGPSTPVFPSGFFTYPFVEELA